MTVALTDTKAAKYACEHWHYTGTMPIGKTVKVGLWEHDQFVGVVVFSNGVGNLQALGFKYGLRREQTCELARVALRGHTMPVSQLVAAALRVVHDTNPDLALVVSYADPAEGHLGRIYQAGNWTYTGPSSIRWEKRLHGKWVHNRTIEAATAIFTRELLMQLPTRYRPAKFRYLYAFTKRLRRQIAKDGLPYPTDDDLAAQVSEARHRSTRPEGQVQSLGAAPTLMDTPTVMDTL